MVKKMKIRIFPTMIFAAIGMLTVVFPAHAAEDGNLAPNPGLIFADGKLDGWEIGSAAGFMQPLANGGFSVKLPAQTLFTLISREIVLNQEKPVTLRYGVTFQGKCFPVSYHHGLVLDQVVYMDGTTESWNATHFIFRFQSGVWSREATSWLPPKPVKSLRLYFIFNETAEADFALKDVFLRQDPQAFSTANSELNFDSTPTNLVSNGNFEIVNAGEPKNWIPFFEMHPLNMSLKAQLDMALDSSVRHSGEYSIRLSGSRDSIAGIESTVTSIIDYTREFTFSGWIKAQNATGNTFLEVKFMRSWAPCGIGSEAGNHLNRVYNRADTVGVYRTPITAGTHDWKKFDVTMKPPAGANLVTFRVYCIDNRGTIWIDDLEFDGFGDAPLEILASQLGYPADGSKKVFIRSRKHLNGTFEILDEAGRTVFSGPLSDRGTDIWQCSNYEADFTLYTAPGVYTFRLLSSSGPFESRPFAIRNDFYESIVESSRDFMFHMRCGFDIPGLHPACHLDDGQLRSKTNLLAGGKVTGHHDVSGGWHDAGDFDKYPGAAAKPVVFFSRLGRRLNSQALLTEAEWGAKWMNKLVSPGGMIYFKLERLAENGQVIIDLCPPESETDNIPGTADDRVVVGPGHDIFVPWSLAEYALVCTDPEEREKYLKTSMLIYEDFLKSIPRGARFNHQCGPVLVQCMMTYYRLTGDRKYLEELKPYLNAILDEVDSRIRENRWDDISEMHYYLWSWAIVPLEYAASFPEEPLAERVRTVLKPFIEEVFKNLDGAPLKTVELTNWPFPQMSATHLSLQNLAISTLMARSAIVFDRKDYLIQAQNNFHFITGINDLGASQISGFGHKTVATWIALNAIPGHADGTVLKGAVLKGISRGTGSRRILPAYLSGGKADYAVDHPANYPAMMIAGDFPMAGSIGCQEVWESVNGEALRAIEAILSAEEHFKKKEVTHE